MTDISAKQEAEAIRRLVVENGFTELDALAQVRAEERGRRLGAAAYDINRGNTPPKGDIKS